MNRRADPTVSVVMPVYNGGKFVAEAMESVLKGTFADLELLVVDDASSDDSAAIIQACADRDERVVLLRLAENRGEADARNHGLARARGEFIAMMDCDDVSRPERLEKQLAFLRANPRIGAVGACFLRSKADLSPLNVFQVPQRHPRIVLNMFIGGGFILHSTLCIRRELIARVGGYEAGRRSVDDLELHSRLLPATGIRYANLPEVLMTYRRHESAIGARDPRKRFMRDIGAVKGRLLKTLWGEAPFAAIARFNALHLGDKLPWAERRRARRDLERLVDALLESRWVDAADEADLRAEIQRRLERTTPRLWQKWLHWRRHNLGR